MAKIDSVIEDPATVTRSTSERAATAREAGNASYKKGKWSEAIGHYTTAALLDPKDPAPLLNRAQAYLKLEKWQDAQRDCTTVLQLPKQEKNVKALFRRALARKELGERQSAEQDLQSILKIEPANVAAKEELQALQKKLAEKGKRPLKIAKSTPIAPSPTSTGIEKSASTSTSKPLAKTATTTTRKAMTSIPIKVVPRFSDSLDSVTEEVIGDPIGSDRSSSPVGTAGPSSFADKKAVRDKRGFATLGTRPPSSSPSQSIPFISSSSSPSSTSPATSISSPSHPSSPRRSATAPPRDSDVIMRSAAPSPAPRLPTSQRAVGKRSQFGGGIVPPRSGLDLFERMERSSDNAERWDIVQSLEPTTLVALISNIIEPDHLAALARTFRSALKSDSGTTGGTTRDDVRDYMLALRGLKRWTMTRLMLSEEEGRVADEVWAECQRE